VHPLDPVTDDRGELEREGRVVRADRRVRRGEHVRMAVVVLEALPGEGRPARRGAHEEAPGPGVARAPELVARPLEPEHRVEDVEGDHRQAVRRVRGRRGLEGSRGARLGDALLEDLAVRRLAVLQHELAVHGLVALAAGRVDPDVVEERVHAEGAGLVRDDRDDPRPKVRIAHEVPQDAGEDHRRRDRGLRARRELLVERGTRGRQLHAGHHEPLRERPTERRPPLVEVLDLLGVGARVVVGRVVELVVRDRQLEPVAEDLELGL
jgi:hypothetical protein